MPTRDLLWRPSAFFPLKPLNPAHSLPRETLDKPDRWLLYRPYVVIIGLSGPELRTSVTWRSTDLVAGHVQLVLRDGEGMTSARALGIGVESLGFIV